MWTELQRDQESRCYRMFKRLNKNFMKIRITLELHMDQQTNMQMENII